MNKGIIILTDELVKSDWDRVSVIFSKFRPTFINQENDIWYFHGLSDSFREIDMGETIPYYIVVFNYYGEGDPVFTFEEAKQ